jgi:hypothetical protein
MTNLSSQKPSLHVPKLKFKVSLNKNELYEKISKWSLNELHLDTNFRREKP